MKTVIKLNSMKDVEWFLNQIDKPFTPNTKLKDALKRYKQLTKQKG